MIDRIGATKAPEREKAMVAIERRVFLKGAGLGALAFTVGDVEVLMTPREARAQGVPFRLLKEAEAEAIEAVGETLVPGARHSGVAHFVDQQVAVPPGEALLEARQLNVRPPFINFYRAAIGAIDRASMARAGKRFAALSAADQHDFVDRDAPEQDRWVAGAARRLRLHRIPQRRGRRGLRHNGWLRPARRALHAPHPAGGEVVTWLRKKKSMS